MVRKQVYITKDQDEQLKRLSHDLGVTEAELIRRGVDLVTAKQEKDEADEAWQELLAFMKERGRLKVPQRPRTWTRDELYDD